MAAGAKKTSKAKSDKPAKADAPAGPAYWLFKTER